MFREEAFYDNYTEEIISPWWLYLSRNYELGGERCYRENYRVKNG